MTESEKDKVRRIGSRFQEELEEIKIKNKEKFGLKKKVSNGKITNMIPKHNFWQKVKNDLINFNFDKKGLTTISIFSFIFFVFIWIVFLGILVIILNLTTTNLDIDIDIGQVNLGDAVQDTLGQYNTAFLANADLIGYVLIFGLIMTMLANAYIFRGGYPKLFIILDIFLLVFAYILAVYVSNTYEILINSTTILDVYINNMQKSSSFVLKLPLFVSIIGVVMMVLSYAGFPRDTKEEIIIGQL